MYRWGQAWSREKENGRLTGIDSTGFRFYRRIRPQELFFRNGIGGVFSVHDAIVVHVSSGGIPLRRRRVDDLRDER